MPGPQIDNPHIAGGQPLQSLVERRPALGIDLAGQRPGNLLAGTRPQFQRSPRLGTGAHAFADIVAIDDEIGPVIGAPAQQDMDMRIVGVPVIHPDPIERGIKIARHVGHEVAGKAAQVLHIGTILGRDDEAEMVAIVLAAPCKIRRFHPVATLVEQAGVLPVAGDAVAGEIVDMPGKWRGAEAGALVTHNPRLDDHLPPVGTEAN